MNSIGLKVQHLGRKKKLFIILLNDFFLGLICWVVFGPPMATYIASEFSSNILEIFTKQWRSFLIPILVSITFLYIFGFYKSLIKFFDSKDSILLCLSGSLIFGFSWSIIHIYQFSVISTSFLSIAILQGMLLAAVFYAFLNISRDIAKYILYPNYSKKLYNVKDVYENMITNIHHCYLDYFVKKRSNDIPSHYEKYLWKIHKTIYLPSIKTDTPCIITRSVIKNFFDDLSPNEQMYVLFK